MIKTNGMLLLIFLNACIYEAPKQVHIKQMDVDKFVIYDRTSRSPHFQPLAVSDSVEIGKLIFQIKSLKLIHDSSFYTGKQPMAKSSFGYYDVDLYFQNKKVDHLDIYYTVYYGVIIFRRNEVYKNDEMEMLIVTLLLKYYAAY